MTEALERAVTFQCGGDSMIGIVHTGQRNSSGPGVLFVVGGPQYRVGSHRQFTIMARALAGVGFSVFRFDYRGMGDSTGHVRTFEDVTEDIRAAIAAFMTAEPQVTSIVLLGLCDGASAVLMACHCDARITGLVLINPWVRTEQSEAQALLRHHYTSRLLSRAFWSKLVSGEMRWLESARDLLRSLSRVLLKRGQGRRVARHFVDRMLTGFSDFRGRTLILLSGDDLTAREFEALCATSASWKSVSSRQSVRRYILPGADHTFSVHESFKEATSIVTEFTSCVARQDCDSALIDNPQMASRSGARGGL